MRNQSACILVVGSGGVIGAALMSRLQYAGEEVVGTTRRREAVDDAHFYLYLADDIDGWQCPRPVAAAVICAGATALEACMRDPAATARVNVCGVTTLVNDLVARGAFVVYLSSNQVFKGSTSHCGLDDPLSPVTEYGRQKAEAERRIGKWGDSVAIVLAMIRGARRDEDIPRYIQLYRLGRLKLDEQIPHRYPLADINEAIVTVRNGHVGRFVIMETPR